MRVLLRRKLAEVIDGVDLSGRNVGDVFDLPDEEARLLIAEGWAIPERRVTDLHDRRREYRSLGSDNQELSQLHHGPGLRLRPLRFADAADRPPRRKEPEQLTSEDE